MTDLRWRFFRFMEIEDALIWAERVGLAVHHSGVQLNGRKTCHLFGPDRETLCEAAEDVGLLRTWIQERDRPILGAPVSKLHFDLYGRPLRRALARCENVELRKSA